MRFPRVAENGLVGKEMSGKWERLTTILHDLERLH
jgi:hypothetical protein